MGGRPVVTSHHFICGNQDRINPRYVCSKDEGHDGAHEDDRYPGWRWPVSRAGLVR